jgi:cytidine deaminase
MQLEKTIQEKLVQMAIAAKEHSYSPYSGFRVGAALLCEDGEIVTGCNVENAAFSPTVCAERTAVVKAVSAGKRKFLALAVAGDGSDYITPCGVCRQVLAEFVNPQQFLILEVKDESHYRIHTAEELLPFSFGAAQME